MQLIKQWLSGEISKERKAKVSKGKAIGLQSSQSWIEGLRDWETRVVDKGREGNQRKSWRTRRTEMTPEERQQEKERMRIRRAEMAERQ